MRGWQEWKEGAVLCIILGFLSGLAYLFAHLPTLFVKWVIEFFVGAAWVEKHLHNLEYVFLLLLLPVFIRMGVESYVSTVNSRRDADQGGEL